MLRRYNNIFALLILYIDIIFISSGAKLMNCPKTDIKLVKVLGVRPSDKSHPLLLYKNENNFPVTTECIAKCQANDQCRSFVIYYNASSCFWYKSSTEDAQEIETVVDTSSAWFVKECLEVKKCEKLWVFERVPGAILIGNDTKPLPELVTRSECQQNCLDEMSFQCRSAKFKIKERNYGPNGKVTGTCTLSNTDRHLLPNSYRVSSYDEEYFENQCANDDQQNRITDENVNESDEFCAYEEYENATLSHSDTLIERSSKEKCQESCEKNQQFNCRGYSVVVKTNSSTSCYLHSEDSKVHGPKLLKENRNGRYYEKARCLNITVSCTETYMTVKYKPEVNFNGRLYMQGYSDHPECFTRGHDLQLVTLKLPLLSNQCGVIKANGAYNRTLISGTMIIQYNQFIQTQGDRLIKIGCIFGNESKILIGTGVTISSSHPNQGSTLVNNTSNLSPMVEMRVVDLHTQEEASDTQIGQELQLVIELKPPLGSLDFWAGHLVAMTEHNEDSILLLDERGCPTNLNVFPALVKIQTNTTKKLVGTFQAFKFASSPIVRFSVIVQFCANECPPVDCGNGVQSFGRKRREIVSRAIETINGTTVLKVDRSDFEKTNATLKELLPLEFVMIVRTPNIIPDKLTFDNNKILVAGYDFATNEVCLDYSLFVGLIVTWVLIQIIFIVCCIFLVRRYKRHYENELTRQSLEELHKNFGIGFSNLDNRRVHWADNEELT